MPAFKTAFCLLLASLTFTSGFAAQANADGNISYGESDSNGFDSETGIDNSDPSISQVSEPSESSIEPEISEQEHDLSPASERLSPEKSRTSDLKLASESASLAARAGVAEGLRLLAFWPDDVHDIIAGDGTPIVGCDYPLTLHCLALNIGDLATNPKSSLGSYRFTLDPSLPPTSLSELNGNAIAYTDKNIRLAEYFDPTASKRLSSTAGFLGFLAPQMVLNALTLGAESGNPLLPATTRLASSGKTQFSFAMARAGTPATKTSRLPGMSLASPAETSLLLSATSSKTVPEIKNFSGSPKARELLEATLEREQAKREAWEAAGDGPVYRVHVASNKLESLAKTATAEDVKAVGDYLARQKPIGERYACLRTFHLSCVDAWISFAPRRELKSRYGFQNSTFFALAQDTRRELLWIEAPGLKAKYRSENLVHEEIFERHVAAGSEWFASKGNRAAETPYERALRNFWIGRDEDGHYSDEFRNRANRYLFDLQSDPKLYKWTEDDAHAYLKDTVFARLSWFDDEADFVFLDSAVKAAVARGEIPPQIPDLLKAAFLNPYRPGK